MASKRADKDFDPTAAVEGVQLLSINLARLLPQLVEAPGATSLLPLPLLLLPLLFSIWLSFSQLLLLLLFWMVHANSAMDLKEFTKSGGRMQDSFKRASNFLRLLFIGDSMSINRSRKPLACTFVVNKIRVTSELLT